MKGFGRRSETAFRAFYEANFQTVYRAAYSLVGDRESALDATQESFKRAYLHWGRIRKEEWAVGWVVRTVMNLGKKERNRARRERGLTLVRTENAPSLGLERLDIVNALRQLPARRREAMVLHYIGDLPIHAVAEVMGLSEGSVKSHLARGRDSLRALLEVEDVSGL